MQPQKAPGGESCRFSLARSLQNASALCGLKVRGEALNSAGKQRFFAVLRVASGRADPAIETKQVIQLIRTLIKTAHRKQRRVRRVILLASHQGWRWAYALLLVCGLVFASGVDATVRLSANAEIAAFVVAAVFLASIMLLAALLPRSMLRSLFALFLAIAVLATAASARYPPTASLSRLALFGDAVLRLTALTLLGLALFQTVFVRRAAVESAFQTAVMVNWSWLTLLGAILAGTAIYVEASHRILFWDPTRYWNATDEVAQLFRNGFGWANFLNLMRTAGDEYSMIPALIPGLLTVPLPAQFLLGYILAVCACYVVPALFAMAVLGFMLARAVAPDIATLRWTGRIDLITLGAVALVALLPWFVQIFLEFALLDVGGTIIIALIAVAWARLASLILATDASRSEHTHALDVLATAVMIAALSVLAFVFRRWYIFDVLGFALAAFLFFALAVRRAPRPFSAVMHDVGIAIAAALLTLISSGITILERWILEWTNRQYTESYAAYWSSWRVEYDKFYNYFGLLIPVGCVAVILYVLKHKRDQALPFVLLVGTTLGIAGFFNVQGMSYQHYYLFMPVFGAAAAAIVILLARLIGSRLTLIALCASFYFLALAPRYGGGYAAVQPVNISLWPQSNPDAVELTQLGHWLANNLKADEYYCVAASSEWVNASLVANIWQLDGRLKGTALQNRAIELNQVDTRDGPPDRRYKGLRSNDRRKSATNTFRSDKSAIHTSCPPGPAERHRYWPGLREVGTHVSSLVNAALLCQRRYPFALPANATYLR